jgi:uncharacterized membrane protein YdjX (TVP38/TMEM64 family)
MRHTYQKLVYACLFIGINIFLWFYFDIGSFLTLETIQQHRSLLTEYVRDHYIRSVFLYILIYTLDAALFLPATALLIMIGGFLFGVIPAACYAVIAATCGATIAFLITRNLLGGLMQERYQAKLKAFNERIERNHIRYLLFVRLVPVFPFFLTNILAGLTLIPLATFVWTTAVGIIPNVTLYACIGRQLTTLTKLSDILTKEFFIVILLLTMLSLLPLFLQKKR